MALRRSSAGDRNPDWPNTGYIHTPSANFAPRIGASYRLDDKTVVRGGFGIYYARLLGSLIDNLWTTNGIYQIADSFSASQSAQLGAGPVFPNILPTAPTGASVSASTIQFASNNLKTPHSAQGNITLQRQISKDTVLSVSGIFSRGIHLLGAQDLNIGQASGSYTYIINNASGQQTGTYTTPLYFGPRPNSKYGAVYDVTNGIDSVYSGLAATFTKRFSHGLQMMASYTWSHEIDDGQGGGSSALFFNSFSNVFNGNNSFERGSGTLDQRHRFVYSFVWSPTVIRSGNQLAKYMLNGWQVSSIVTLAAGRPAGNPSITVSTALPYCSSSVPQPCITLPAGATGLLSTSVIDGLVGGSSRVPFLPVNSIYTPASYHADARLRKFIPIKIGDRETNLSLNFEAFNVSNSWTPTSLSTRVYTASKGAYLATPIRSLRGPLHRYLRNRFGRRRLPGWHTGAAPAGQRPLLVLTRFF